MRSFCFLMTLIGLSLNGLSFSEHEGDAYDYAALAAGCERVCPICPAGPPGTSNDTHGYIYRNDQNPTSFNPGQVIPMNILGVLSSDVVGNGTGFTVNRSGRYLVSYDVRPFQGNGVPSVIFSGNIELIRNTSLIAGSGTGLFFSNESALTVYQLHGQAIVSINSGDTISLRVSPLSQNPFNLQSVLNSQGVPGSPTADMSIVRLSD